MYKMIAYLQGTTGVSASYIYNDDDNKETFFCSTTTINRVPFCFVLICLCVCVCVCSFVFFL